MPRPGLRVPGPLPRRPVVLRRPVVVGQLDVLGLRVERVPVRRDVPGQVRAVDPDGDEERLRALARVILFNL